MVIAIMVIVMMAMIVVMMMMMVILMVILLMVMMMIMMIMMMIVMIVIMIEMMTMMKNEPIQRSWIMKRKEELHKCLECIVVAVELKVVDLDMTSLA